MEPSNQEARRGALVALWPDAGPAIVVSEADYDAIAALWDKHGCLLARDAESDHRALAHLFRRQLSPAAQLSVGCIARILSAARKLGRLPAKDAIGAPPAAASVATVLGLTAASALEGAFDALYAREFAASGRSKRNVLLEVLAVSMLRHGGHR